MFTSYIRGAALGALVAIGGLVGSPAGAATKSATFCANVEGLSIIAPALPTSDSLSAIATAMSKLPSDKEALTKVHVRLLAAANVDSNAASAAVLRSAAGSVSEEILAINDIIGDEATVLADPTSSSAITTLAAKVVSASSSAGAANAYLAVERPFLAKTCS